jgi:FAD:protein FMN transferase
MGTRLSIVLPGGGKEKALEATLAEAQRLDPLLNRHCPQSPLALLNAGEGCRDEELIGILKECLHHKEKTQSCFDVNVAGLMALWQIEHGKAKTTNPPDQQLTVNEMEKKHREDEALATAIANGKFPTGQTFGIDLGGFAKGYAMDRMTEKLRELGVQDAFISFGESSIAGLGRHPAGKSWPVSVPTGQTQIDYQLKDESLSISGSFAPDGGKPRYGHIINPAKGQTVTGHDTAIVQASSATVAEVLSTALLACADVAKQRAIMSNYADSNARIFSFTDEKHKDILEL